jgi:hypothetical protein
MLASPLVVGARAAAQSSSSDPQTESRGQHWRLESELGVVHAWRPEGYDPATAGVVAYVHGYGSPIDDVWNDHALAGQFDASGRNALFLVPEAPQSNQEHVHFTKLEELLTVVREGGVDVPSGSVAVAGHSGGFRTIVAWLGDRRMREIILLDAVYGRDTPFRSWLSGIGTSKSQTSKKLVMVGADTARRSERLARRYKIAVRRVGVPDSIGAFTRRERSAPILYMRSQYEHMQIVLSGRVVPVLLQLTSLAGVSR